MKAWSDDVVAFCNLYNIPVQSLVEILRDPKVIPMIRGKAFEFCVAEKLKDFLPDSEWKVDKPFLNPQLGIHDSDVRVTHIHSGKVLSIECKMADKGSYKYLSKLKTHSLRVKCMRSRTLGEEKVKQLAPVYGIKEEVLKIHNDQYLPTDFSLVITSIGNAFYETEQNTGIFIWQPDQQGVKFLSSLQSIYNDTTSLKDFSFNRMYVSRACDIAVTDFTEVVCTRKKCNQKHSCGFIPNYPIIEFKDGNKSPTSRWLPIEESLLLFESFIHL